MDDAPVDTPRTPEPSVRWVQHFSCPRMRVDSHGIGQWEAGLLVDGERHPRLKLHEDRIRALSIPLTEYLDPYGVVELESLKVGWLRRDLLAGRSDVSGWKRDYADALIELCDEAHATVPPSQIYYDGP